MQTEKQWQKDGYLLRSAQPQDTEAYFSQNYVPLDQEIARLTGCREVFSKEEVLECFEHYLTDDDRILFLLIAPDGRIAGETVLNEINPILRCANFRIGIFILTSAARGWAAGWFASRGIMRLKIWHCIVWNWTSIPSTRAPRLSTAKPVSAGRVFCGMLCWMAGAMLTIF